MKRRRKPAGPDRLAALYAQVPKVRCKGLCTDECTTLPVGPTEAARCGAGIAARGSRSIGQLADPCPSLTADGRCGIYRDRPMICRLYGAAVDLPCEHGCEVEGGALPADVAQWLLRQAIKA